MKDLEGLKPVPEGFPAIIARISAGMLVMAVAVLALGAMSLKRRGQCVATGDIAHSDGMTVDYKFSPDCYKMISDDGRKYDFCVNPTTQTNWPKGTYVEFSDYEMRDGYADFTVPKARLKKFENKEAYLYDVSRRR